MNESVDAIVRGAPPAGSFVPMLGRAMVPPTWTIWHVPGSHRALGFRVVPHSINAVSRSGRRPRYALAAARVANAPAVATSVYFSPHGRARALRAVPGVR